MRFKEIKVCELTDFINSDLYKNSRNLAITQQRVISQLNNPRANKNHIVLIIAINDFGEIVGFIGSLPDKINKLPNINFSWNSCWWIDQEKGRKSAIPLLLKFLKVWNNNVAFRDMTPVTKKIIERLNKFKTIKKLNGFRYFLRFNTNEIIPKKFKILVIFKPFLLALDFILNFIIRLKPINKSINYSVKHIDFIDDEAALFIKKLNENELFKRKKDELNWIIKYPWVVKESKNKNQFYYFSDTSINFKNYLLKVYDNNSNLIGVLFLNNHNGLFKIPYAYFKKENLQTIVQFTYTFLIEKKAISFLTYNDLLNNEFQKNNNPFWYKKQDFKELVIFEEIAKQINWDFMFQDGDGDFVFT